MLNIIALSLITIPAVFAKSEASVDEEEQARFGFVSVNSDGSLSLTYNQTSLQYTLLVGLVVLVITAILLPLLGLIGLDKDKYEEGFEFDDKADYRSDSSYQKRSLGFFSSIMDMLSKAAERYGEDDEKEN